MRSEIILTVYYVLLCFTGCATLLQILILHHAILQQRALHLLDPRPSIAILAQQRTLSEWFRLGQHSALFIIFIIPLPINALRLWRLHHFWIAFSIDAVGLALIPLLLLASSLVMIKTAQRLHTLKERNTL